MEAHKHIELYQMKWLLGQSLALVSLASVFTLELGAEWVGLFVGITTLLSFCQPRLIQWIPPLARKLLLGVLVVFVVMDFMESGADFIPPLARMVIWLLAFRVLEYRSRREDLQVVLLSLFLVISTGVLSMELSFALQLLIYCPLAMITLFTVTLDEGNRRMQEVPENPFSIFRWSAFLQWVRVSIDRRLLIFSSLLFVGFSLMAASLFVILPRFEFGQSLPFMRLQASSSLSGFSDSVRFGDVVDIIKDDRVALRVDVPSGRPDVMPYWRMVALDEYFLEGFRQSISSRDQNRIYANHQFERRGETDREWRGEAAWVFYLEGGVSRYLPIPGDFRELKFQSRQEVEFNSLLDLIQLKETPASVLFYQLKPVELDRYTEGWGRDSELDQLDHPIYSVVGRETQPSSIRYPDTLMVLPADELTQSVLEESIRSIKADYGEWIDVSQFGVSATEWLQSRHHYGLQTEIPEGKGNRIVRWIASDRSGHCELFAGSLVFLARQAGIPARMVNGFQGGDWNGYENYYMVRNLNAHAWVELYDRENGWIRADPTPTLGNDGLDNAVGHSLFVDRTIGAYLDSLRVVWYRRVVNFDQIQQRHLAKGLSDDVKEGLVWLKGKVVQALGVLKNWVTDPVGSNGWWKLPLYVFGLWALFLGLQRSFRLLVQRGYSRQAKQNYQRRIAGKLLNRLAELHRPLDSRGERLCSDLLTIRYGQEGEWTDSPVLFRDTKQYLRKERWSLNG